MKSLTQSTNASSWDFPLVVSIKNLEAGNDFFKTLYDVFCAIFNFNVKNVGMLFLGPILIGFQLQPVFLEPSGKVLIFGISFQKALIVLDLLIQIVNLDCAVFINAFRPVYGHNE